LILFYIGLAASRIAISGNYMLRRPKHSKNEVVAPKEEEDYIIFTKHTTTYTH
jgi:hypothetical protein